MIFARSMSAAARYSHEYQHHDMIKRDGLEDYHARDGFVFLGFAIAITLMRTYSRWRMVGFKGFQADDLLVWFAMALYVAETVNDNTIVTKFRGLANSDMTDAERAALDPDSEEYRLRVGGSRLHLIAWPIYVTLLWSLKAAMAVFYLRLMDHVGTYRRKIYIGFALIGVTFLIVVLIPFLSCIPIRKMWQINPDPGPLCYPESSPAILWTILTCNIVTDAYLLWLPMPMLFQSTLPKYTKISLMLLFGCGILVTIAAALTILFVVTRKEDGDTHDMGFWAARETFVAILTTNLPSIFVLLRLWLKPSLAFLRSRSTGMRTGGRSGAGGGGGGGGGGGAGGSMGKYAGGSRASRAPSSSTTRASRLFTRQTTVGGGGGDGDSKQNIIMKTSTISNNNTTSGVAMPSPPPPVPRFKQGFLTWSSKLGGESGGLTSPKKEQQQSPPESICLKRMDPIYDRGEKSASQEEILIMHRHEEEHHSNNKTQQTTQRPPLGDAFYSSDSGVTVISSGGGRRGGGVDNDDSESLRSSKSEGGGGFGARVTRKMSLMKRNRRGSDKSDKRPATSGSPTPGPESSNNSGSGGGGGLQIQRHVEVSISNEPSVEWGGLDSPQLMPYTVTRAYNEPLVVVAAPPNAVVHYNHHQQQDHRHKLSKAQKILLY